MKKALKITAIVAFTGLALASCKNDYTCTCDIAGTSVSVEYTDLDKDQASAQETSCTTAGCAWAKK